MAKSLGKMHWVLWPALFILLCVLFIFGAGLGWFMGPQKQGDPVASKYPADLLQERAHVQARALASTGLPPAKQILFGDLHVHTTFSADAFAMSLPISGGEGAHPISDACDYARFCSALDFWSINDHGFALTPARWRETIDEIRQCNAVATQGGVPDTLAFLGWEWTQVGVTPEYHYGHKNVVLRGLEDDDIPPRPIVADAQPGTPALLDVQPPTFAIGILAATQIGRGGLSFANYLAETNDQRRCEKGVPSKELPLDCQERAQTPADLFAILDEWSVDALVIPHGTTWGMYTPPGSSWDKQLTQSLHSPERQRLIEVYSGHGNSEEYRSFREVVLEPDGTRSCPEPVEGYLSSCWRAGEIIEARCLAEAQTSETCAARAAQTRQYYVDGDGAGHQRVVPGNKEEDWLDAGECRDCFQPSFKYRPSSSVQYILALGNPDAPIGFDQFHFGFIASSDNHSSRPGTGYKEIDRTRITEARFNSIPGNVGTKKSPPISEGIPYDFFKEPLTVTDRWEFERAGSYFLSGGLTAVHAEGRDRDAIWQAWQRREVYGTSGPRILLWFDLLEGENRIPMGQEWLTETTPTFEVRALGSFEQKPGCPDYNGISEARLDKLCHNECYNPNDSRRAITRIEVVRITPRLTEAETPEALIEDPWMVIPCDPNEEICHITFTDQDYEALGRNATYYVRAIEQPSQAIGAEPVTCERDERGNCIKLITSCNAGLERDDCLSETEQRAWSSPIYLRAPKT